MEIGRWTSLMRDEGELSPEELADGWHFCPDWDGLLVGPSMGELRCCVCECAKHVARPPEEQAPPGEVWVF